VGANIFVPCIARLQEMTAVGLQEAHLSAKLRAASTCTFPATMPGCQEIIVPPRLPAVAVKCTPTLPFWCDPTTSSVPPVVGPSHALCCVLQPAGHIQTAVPGSCAAAAAPKLRTIPRLGPAAQARPGARRRGLRAGRHARRLPKRRSSEEVPSAGTVAQAEHALRCQVRANKLTRTLLGAPAAACPSRCRPCPALRAPAVGPWQAPGASHLVSRRSTTLGRALSRTDARLPAPRTTECATLAHVDLGDACAWQGLF